MFIICIFLELTTQKLCPNLLAKKIENIHKTISDIDKSKPHINMTTKGPSHKQIIIPMSENNISKFMVSLSNHITNLNHTKCIKSDTFIDFICKDYWGLIVIANKVASPSDMSTIENYIKNVQNIDANEVQSVQLS